MASNAQLNGRWVDVKPSVGVICDFYAQPVENASLCDVPGNELIDFASGIAALKDGHCHPKVDAAVEAQ